ncbi:hypothetical protein [Promicromonospora sp. MEB111]|nr:hypothetical protein [Promicromonospora sp. MEB111]
MVTTAPVLATSRIASASAAEVSNQDLPRHVAADLAVQSFRRGVAP